jgi:hypothetical protein
MTEKTFIAYCTNGLGNRLLPLASAMAYCQLTGRRLRVYWDDITPSGCLAPLSRLFQNQFDLVTLDEIAALGLDRRVGLYSEHPSGQGVRREAERFRRTALLQLSQRVQPHAVQALRLDDNNDTVVVFSNEFLSAVPTLLSIQALRSLVPSQDIADRVAAEIEALQLSPGMPAVHARGTDFEVADALAMYSDGIRRTIGGQRFYLSTEDAQLEAGLRQRFAGQLISRRDRLHLQLARDKQVWCEPDSYTNSVAHGVDALVDLYLLSRAQLVVTHPNSTFAAVARHLHAVPGAWVTRRPARAPASLAA